jgi:hypothetical protein
MRLRDRDPTLPLNRITIPGTHDSGTANCSGNSRCQSTSIDTQLRLGVRYLDIRLDSDSNDLPVVHGNVHGSGNPSPALYFKDVAASCHDFLTSTATSEETIFLQVKSDRGPDPGMHAQVVAQLKDAFQDAPDHLWLDPLQIKPGPPPPTIGPLTGKLVLIRRYMLETAEDPIVDGGTEVHSFATGLVFNDWSGGTSTDPWSTVYAANKFEWPGDTDNEDYFHGPLYDYRNRNGLSFIIQDYYSTSVTATKWTLVQRYLNHANAGLNAPGSWFFNFSSCASPEASANVINPQLKTYLATTTPNHGFGTVLMDFVDEDLVETVYKANGL